MGVIHHSDQGVPYAVHDYVDTLRASGFEIRLVRKGNPYDNAVAESVMELLKHEEVYLSQYRTLDVVVYGNDKRGHAALSYLPSEEFEGCWKPVGRR